MSVLHAAVVGAAVATGAVLLISALPKARKPAEFAEQVADYKVLPARIAPVVARLVLSAEFVAGLMLLGSLSLTPLVRQVGAALAVTLFALFSVALGTALARGAEIDCACFGGNSQLEVIGPQSLVRTMMLLALAVVAGLRSSRSLVLPGIGFGVLFLALVILISELVRMLGPLRRTTDAFIAQLATAQANATPQKEVR